MSVSKAIQCAEQWAALLDAHANDRAAGRGRRRLYPVAKQSAKAPAAPSAALYQRWGQLSAQAASEVVAVATPIDGAPWRSGVYVLVRDARCLYVGKATALAARLARHQARGWSDAAWAVVVPERVSSVERQLLDLFVPTMNRDPRTRRIRSWLQMPEGLR